MGVKTFSPNAYIRETDGTLRFALIIKKNFRQQNLTIGTSAVKIPTSPLSNRINILIVNNSTNGQILYLGDNTVSSSNGMPLYPRQSLHISIEDDVDIYGIASAAGADIRIVEGS